MLNGWWLILAQSLLWLSQVSSLALRPESGQIEIDRSYAVLIRW